jgi:hypothetical protein
MRFGVVFMYYASENDLYERYEAGPPVPDSSKTGFENPTPGQAKDYD